MGKLPNVCIDSSAPVRTECLSERKWRSVDILQYDFFFSTVWSSSPEVSSEKLAGHDLKHPSLSPDQVSVGGWKEALKDLSIFGSNFASCLFFLHCVMVLLKCIGHNSYIHAYECLHLVF